MCLVNNPEGHLGVRVATLFIMVECHILITITSTPVTLWARQYHSPSGLSHT